MVKTERKRGSKKKWWQKHIVLLISVALLAIVSTALIFAISYHRGGNEEMPCIPAYNMSNAFASLANIEVKSGVPDNYAFGVPHIVVVNIVYSSEAEAKNTSFVVPLYFDTQFYKNITIDSNTWHSVWSEVAKKTGLNGYGIPRAIIIGEAEDKTFWSNTLSRDSIIIQFALSTCPHCHAMWQFFSQNIENKLYILCLDKS
ncbi:MAG: hypothetical protein JHC33_06815 [Ignisphaera sp.]|nr:hypothetical protein [Ignisphaera sp.]